MKNNIKQKIINAIKNNRFSLIEGKRNWYNYIVDIQGLVWVRNLRDGYNIFIYDKNMNQLDEIQIDYNLDTIK